MHSITYFYLFSLITLFVLNGCAYNDAKVKLKYDPVFDLNTQNHNLVPVFVQKFDDNRSNKKVIGEVRNLHGQRTADVLIDNGDPSVWITEALIGELKNSGLNVTPALKKGDKKESLNISGDISELFISVNLDFIYRCTVRSHIQVSRGSTLLLDKDFVGKGESEANWGTPEERENAVKFSLQNLMKRAVPDIIEVIQ